MILYIKSMRTYNNTTIYLYDYIILILGNKILSLTIIYH